MPRKQKDKFDPKVVDKVRELLRKTEAALDTADSSLEQPSDGQDAELILGLLDDVRRSSGHALDVWTEEQYRVFPETKP